MAAGGSVTLIVVLPEGTAGAGQDRPRTSRLAALGLALAALTGAVFVVGRSTAPIEDAAFGVATTSTTTVGTLPQPTTTTSIEVSQFRASDIAAGDRFSWIKAATLGRFWPVDLVHHKDRVYLFGSRDIWGQVGATIGLSGWVTSDGFDWKDLGEVTGGDHMVFRVVSTGDELVALGARVANGAPVIWRSADGSSWSPAELPVDQEILDGSLFRLGDAVEFEGRLLLSGTAHPDPFWKIQRSLPGSRVGEDPRMIDVAFRRDEATGGIVDVFGPLGLYAFTSPLEELGFGDPAEDQLFEPQADSRQFIWSWSDDDGWAAVPSDLGSTVVDEIWLRPDGTLVALGPGDRQTTTSMSEDGRLWTRMPRSMHSWLFQIDAKTVWGDALVGAGVGEDLFLTRNGIDWERVGTGQLLPDAIGWELGPVAAGEAGLVTVARALAPNQGPHFTPVVIEKDGSSLTVDIQAAMVHVETSAGDRWDVPLWSAPSTGLVSVDFVGGTAGFTNPASGETVVEVDFATLRRAEATAISFERSAERVLLFTTDGIEWSVQGLTDVIGPEHGPDEIVVLADRVIVITSPSHFRWGLGEPPQPAIRVGMIP